MVGGVTIVRGVVIIRGGGGEGTLSQFFSLGCCKKLKSRRFFSKSLTPPPPPSPPTIRKGRVWCSYWALKSLFCLRPSLRGKRAGKHGKFWNFGFSFLRDLAARNLFEILIPALIKLSLWKYKLQPRHVWCLSWPECVLKLVWAMKVSQKKFFTNNFFIWYFST